MLRRGPVIADLDNRSDQLDDQAALAQGLPIGSGEIDSAHRYIVQQRLNRPGAWTLGNAPNTCLPCA